MDQKKWSSAEKAEYLMNVLRDPATPADWRNNIQGWLVSDCNDTEKERLLNDLFGKLYRRESMPSERAFRMLEDFNTATVPENGKLRLKSTAKPTVKKDGTVKLPKRGATKKRKETPYEAHNILLSMIEDTPQQQKKDMTVITAKKSTSGAASHGSHSKTQELFTITKPPDTG